MNTKNETPGQALLRRLRHHVTGAIERGEAQAIVGVPSAGGRVHCWVKWFAADPVGYERTDVYCQSSGEYLCIPVDVEGRT